MCFSAGASFGAGLVLSVIGIASIKKVQAPSQFFFAAIPFLFSIQQISEGFLWLALTNPAWSAIQSGATYTFLFFAQIVWPFWVPFAILQAGNPGERKFIQKLLVGTGIIVSGYLAYCLLSFKVEATIAGHHISYLQDYPALPVYYGIVLYLIATVAPPFFSGLKKMWILGATILISYIITTLFYEDYILSVWCFFASVISLLVLAILHENKALYSHADGWLNAWLH